MFGKTTTWARQNINDIERIINEIVDNINTNYDMDFCKNKRGNINCNLIQAIFGAEIVQKNDGKLYLKFSKVPATMGELAELTQAMDHLVNKVEKPISIDEKNTGTEDEDENKDKDDIPKPSDVSNAIIQLKPEKINSKTLSSYLLSSDQAIASMKLKAIDVAILAGISEQYRKERKTKIILLSTIIAVAIAAGVTTTAVVMNNNKKSHDDNTVLDDDVIDIDSDVDIE